MLGPACSIEPGERTLRAQQGIDATSMARSQNFDATSVRNTGKSVVGGLAGI